ncbi:HlyD family secretion protein [Iodobacter sp. CM08]|uniref:HlyD family secretion protein n=1 Tax=Iodobacter sp. CM08 TaxID=3085902 RepID=UPI00298204C0|nr:HlyD family secretion protein [Iodobacter sp. CM08]MDW5417247.1 HlyD family secretion protein [Iodobacter sp. CM08]
MSTTPTADKTMSTKPASPARNILLLILLIVLCFLSYRWWWGKHHVSSDNAQLEGHIVPIAARVSGYVKAVPVSDNQQMAQKSLLIELDPRDYQVKVAQAEADYRQALSAAGHDKQPGEALARIAAAEANAAAASSQSQTAEAQITEARANAAKARKDLARSKELAAQKMLSQSALESADTLVKAAEAKIAALEAALRTSKESANAAGQQVAVSSAGLKSAQAKALAAEATLQFARNQLIDTQVYAPAAGVVSKKAVEPGQMIQAGQTLMYLVPTDKIWVIANLKETELKQIKLGQEAEIEVDAFPDLKLKGKVDSFSPATGARFTLLPADNSTGNFTKVVQRVPVKIILDELPKGSPLRPGLSVNVTIHTP